MRFNRNIGWLLMAIWLILTGLIQLVGVGIPAVIMGLLALAAGIFILLNR